VISETLVAVGLPEPLIVVNPHYRVP